MSFTRFHDDPCRINKQLQESTGLGRYMLNVPGNGSKPIYMDDPFIRMQKWGGNLWTHSIDIQSSLLGIDRQLNRDCLRVDKNGKDVDKYKRQTVYASPIDYPVCDTLTTEQSRAIMPAWTARDLQQNHAYLLPNNPQANTEMPFQNYSSTRILEKDSFKREFQCVPQNNQFYTVPTDVYNSQYKAKNSVGSNICKSDCSKM